MPSIPPFKTTSAYLQISTDKRNDGIDYDNLRDTYISNKAFTYTNTYLHPITGAMVKGEWYEDEGYLVMPKIYQESRHYCIKGLAAFSFVGKNLIIRIMLDSTQGTASVLIDGKKPSEITGVTQCTDTLDCNLDNYQISEDQQFQYHDIIVAEGLENKMHTCQICADNKPGVYFLIACAKVRDFRIEKVVTGGYHESATSGLNNFNLRFINQSNESVRELSLHLPQRFLNRATGLPFSDPHVIDRIGSGEEAAINMCVDGLKYEDAIDLTTTFSVDYKDFYGEIIHEQSIKKVLEANSNELSFQGEWLIDNDTPDKRVRAFCECGTGGTVSFKCSAESITITIQVDMDWGEADVIVKETGQSYQKLQCHYEPAGFKDITVNLPPGEKTIILQCVRKMEYRPFVFSRVSFMESPRYTRVYETIPIRMDFKYIEPFGVTGFKFLNEGNYKWNPINLQRKDYAIPRTNVGAKEIHVMRRYPTFALNYSDKGHENLKYYDLIVVDPGTVTRKEVKAWQDMGIKVFGYVSFGEEDGILIDPWNIKSLNMPHIDDGGGPGGYASYYCKGGNSYAELNQCEHDGLIEINEKRCILGDDHYFTGVGCCTRVCQHDYRTAYNDCMEGLPCKGGYKKNNYWTRTGDEACTNAKCPKYKPYHGGCRQYEHHDGWGQDLNYTTPDYPDQNGIWGSTYINPLAPRWKEKLSTFYLRRVFGLPQEVKETITLTTYTEPNVGISYIFRTAQYPIDKDEPVHLYTVDGREYPSITYNFDNTTGAFQVDAEAGAEEGYPVKDGAKLIVSYHVVGMGADGVFMDTLDTVDVYPSQKYITGMSNMINELKEEYPNQYFLANRGFTIIEDIIKSCAYVMFETFISEYNWETDSYYRLTDADTNEYNEGIKELLRNLRKTYQFDVLALNYCSDDPEGDELREIIAQECYAEGYLSWSANIMLNNVMKPVLVKSNEWKQHVKPNNPFFKSQPVVESGWLARYQNEVAILSEHTECNRAWRRLPEVERDEWYEIWCFEMKDFFADEVTTMAWCWKIELSDGTVMGFTSCDVDLEIEGVIYDSCTGFAPTSVESSNDMAVDNLDVNGMITSDRITTDDIFIGRYDNAKITIFVCDYENTASIFILRKGTIGKITNGKSAFQAEIRGLLEAYQQVSGKVYQKTCRAKFGDDKCRINKELHLAWGKVTIVNQDGTFNTDLVQADGWFDYGLIEFTTGYNAGAAYEVEKYVKVGGKIYLFTQALKELNVNDVFKVWAGCNGNASTCRNKYKNFANFRGEPYTPGNDYTVSYPVKEASNVVPEGAPVKRADFAW